LQQPFKAAKKQYSIAEFCEKFYKPVGSNYMHSALLIKRHLTHEFEISPAESATMAVEYIENLERLYLTASKVLDGNSWDDLDRLGHSVKGTSGNVGAYSTAEIGVKMQKACETEDINQFNEGLVELKETLHFLKKSQEELYKHENQT